MLTAFVGADPRQVNHKDGAKANNNLANLEYVTHQENQDHAWATGLNRNFGEGNGRAKLKLANVLEIRKTYVPFKRPLRYFAEKFNVSISAIAWVVNGQMWRGRV